MKFSINNLISKYNLVLIISILIILFVLFIVLNMNSYKDHMDNIIPEIEITQSDPIVSSNSFIPICLVLNETDCSKNSYCNWNLNKKMCNKLDVCKFLDKTRCTNSKNCIWDDGRNRCLYK